MKSGFLKTCMVIALSTLLMGLSGCDFSTYVKTDKKPEETLSGFFGCLYEGKLTGCEEYLADSASFEIHNGSGYAFSDEILNAQLTSLSYEVVGEIEIVNDTASCRVRVTGLDISEIEAAMIAEYPSARSAYILETGAEGFSTDDSETLNAVLSKAFNSIIGNISPTSREVTINMKFQDGMWKIIPDDALCKAVFGGDAE